jgi:RNA polymerase sigma-70 factor (ECF subfamily)
MKPDELRDRGRFQELVEPYRRELAAHCYRMLGSLADAEDQVQETMLSAWRGIDGFEGRASLRSWLYTIATNRCLDVIRRQPRRGMPAEHGAPADPTAPLAPASDELPWVDPAPAAFGAATPASPEATFSTRESVQLAFVVALQHLPATQRSVLILRDVVGWSASEVADLLGTTVASVNSTQQRARATLDARRERAAPATVEDPALLARYARAWEAGDVAALVALLHEDVITSMPPLPAWFRGRDAFATFITPRIAVPDALRVVRIEGADDLAFAFYRRPDGTSPFAAHAIQVTKVEDGLISEIHQFLIPSLFAHFALPPTIDR